MANRHIKVINGRKYYYASIRNGKKVTSKYLGPVERIRRKKLDTHELNKQDTGVGQEEIEDVEQELDTPEDGNISEDESIPEDENYIG